MFLQIGSHTCSIWFLDIRICDQVCKNQQCQHIKITQFFQVLQNKFFTTNVEFNGESFKTYRMQILSLEMKILMNI